MKNSFFGIKLPEMSVHERTVFQDIIKSDLNLAHKILFRQFKERLLYLLINKYPEVVADQDLTQLFSFNSDHAEKQRKAKLHLGAEFIWALPQSMNMETGP